MVGGLFALASVAIVNASDGLEEYKVKAALVLNFARFAQWPPEAFVKTPAQLTLCLLDSGPVAEAFKVLQGKQVKDKQLYLKTATPIRDLGSCHIVFVESSDRMLLPRIFAAIRGRPVLTVGETGGFTELGGVINLVMAGKKIRFVINVDAAQAAGINISSRLLKLATVYRNP